MVLYTGQSMSSDKSLNKNNNLNNKTLDTDSIQGFFVFIRYLYTNVRNMKPNIRKIIRESIHKVLKEEYGEYYRRYNKLKGVAKNQGQLDAQKQKLTNDYETAVADYQNPNYDAGFNASNKLMQHQFKQSSVNNFNRTNANFENAKNLYDPKNFNIQVPQPYIDTYNQWLQLNTEYQKASQIYYNEYSRVNGRINTVNNNKRLSGEFDKLNNFYQQKVQPLQQQVTQCTKFLNYWSPYLRQMSIQQQGMQPQQNQYQMYNQQ